MKLSRDEELFLRHWIYDEFRYQEGRDPAKQLQIEHGAVPADLGTLIAATIPDLSEQGAVGIGPHARRRDGWNLWGSRAVPEAAPW
jgi:hypothetical protein